MSLTNDGEFDDLLNAGIWTKAELKKKLGLRKINALNVAEKSEKLTDRLSNVEETTQLLRPSLALSSTMMVGASLILDCQVDKLLEDTLKLLKASDPTRRPVQKKSKKKSPSTRIRPLSPLGDEFTMPEDPPTPDYTVNTAQDPDQITMREDDVMPPVPIHERDDWFGAATPDEIRWVNNSPVDIEDRTNVNAGDTDVRVDTETEPPAPVQQPQDPTPPEVFGPTGEDGSTTVPVTPGTPKRKPSSPRISDTPKRRRIPGDDAPEVQPIAPQDPAEMPPRTPEASGMSIRTTISDVSTPIRRRRQRKLQIDKKRELSPRTMNRWRRDDRFQTKPLEFPDLMPISVLFTKPCTLMTKGSAWAGRLLADYQEMVIPPYYVEPELPTQSPPREREVTDNTDQLSKGASGTSKNIPGVPPESSGPVIPTIEEPSSTVPDPDVIVPSIEEPSGTAQEPDVVPPIEEPSSTVGEAEIMDESDLRRLPKDVRRLLMDPSEYSAEGKSSSSSGQSLGRPIVTLPTDVKGQLFFLWAEKEVVDFKDLCPVATTGRQKAGQTFSVLLSLENGHVIELHQDVPYGRIIIKKYSASP